MTTSVVSISLPSEQLKALDEFAETDRRSRSSTVAIAVDEFLARHRVGGQQRLQELERLAGEEIARANGPSPGSDAGAAHLAEHRRLCGFQPNSELHHLEGEKP
jgi:predicted transcriptional regulator